MKKQVVLCSVPRIAPGWPQSAPALLKSLCNEAGVTSQVLDFNRDFYLEFCAEYPTEGKEIDAYFITFNSKLTESTEIIYKRWLKKIAERILSYKSDYIGISVFTWEAQRITEDLLNELRPKTQAIIFIGGQGLLNSQNLSAHRSPKLDYAWRILDAKLIDYFFKGDSEETFVRFIKGERELPGLNNENVLITKDFSQIPFSDFSDTDIFSYAFPGGRLPIESGRGCIRNCSFCEMSTKLGAYHGKGGVKTANEMISYYEKYNVRNFYFHDDLMNGDSKEFVIFLETLIDYYKKNNFPDRYFTFSGFYIFKNEKQFPAHHYELLARAGGDTFVVGIETGSDRLRKIVRKGFTNEDADYNLKQIDRLKMKFYFMLIAGLPNETFEDFEENIKLLNRWQVYVARGTIIGVNLGTTATLEPGTHIYNNPEKYRIVGLSGKQPEGINWMCLDTPELDYKERVRRRLKLTEVVTELGYTLWKGDDHLRIIKDRWLDSKDLWQAHLYNKVLTGE